MRAILSPSSGVFPLLLKHYFQDVFQDRERGALTIAREKMFVTLGMAIRKDLDRALSRKIKRTLRTLTETGIADKLMKEAMARLTSPVPLQRILTGCSETDEPQMSREQFQTISRGFLVLIIVSVVCFLFEVVSKKAMMTIDPLLG